MDCPSVETNSEVKPLENALPEMDPRFVLDSLNEGAYVTDPNRRILFWNRSAARITGWSPEETLGRPCSDNLLVHVDKDGHALCGGEYCPLHRAIVTNQGSLSPVLIFAQAKDGRRIPMQASAAPVHDAAGKVIGGVEVFRDVSDEFADLRRARRIQELALGRELPRDDRVSFATRYVPHDIVGGDYFAVSRLDADRFGFLVGDVTGHGASAALYTVHLGSLWAANAKLIRNPGRFARVVSDALSEAIGEDESFVTAVCGVIDLGKGVVRLASAGGPAPILLRDGRCECLDLRGLPLGMGHRGRYEEVEMPIRPGDCLLLCTDGATEINDAAGQGLGVDGLMRILQQSGYPQSAGLKDVEEALLKYSNRIRLHDDLTFLEVRLTRP